MSRRKKRTVPKTALLVKGLTRPAVEQEPRNAVPCTVSYGRISKSPKQNGKGKNNVSGKNKASRFSERVRARDKVLAKRMTLESNPVLAKLSKPSGKSHLTDPSTKSEKSPQTHVPNGQKFTKKQEKKREKKSEEEARYISRKYMRTWAKEQRKGSILALSKAFIKNVCFVHQDRWAPSRLVEGVRTISFGEEFDITE